MMSAVFQTMWLRLWRDKGALLLAFILPGFIFAIFAAIFSNASGGSLDLRVAMALSSDAPASVAFADKIKADAEFSLSFEAEWTEEDVLERVRLGQDDVGFVIASDLADPSTPAIHIIKDPSRDVAATILKGQIRQMIAAQSVQDMPEIFEDVSALNDQNLDGPADQSVTYYIGGTAILFLLFSAMQGASISIEERRSGIADRLMVGRGGAMAMTLGKFAFLTLIGFVQAGLIVAVAYLFFKVPITQHMPALAIACLGSAMLASSLALLVAALCSSTSQMNAVSTFLVLLFSAIGGSMVPRFMMPEWLQSLGIFTPNHWAIEAFYGILARGQSLLDLLVVWGVLFGGSAILLILAVWLSHKLMRV